MPGGEMNNEQELLQNVVRAYFNDNGAESSVSVLASAMDEARDYLNGVKESEAIEKEYPWPEPP